MKGKRTCQIQPPTKHMKTSFSPNLNYRLSPFPLPLRLCPGLSASRGRTGSVSDTTSHSTSENLACSNDRRSRWLSNFTFICLPPLLRFLPFPVILLLFLLPPFPFSFSIPIFSLFFFLFICLLFAHLLLPFRAISLRDEKTGNISDPTSRCWPEPLHCN